LGQPPAQAGSTLNLDQVIYGFVQSGLETLQW